MVACYTVNTNRDTADTSTVALQSLSLVSHHGLRHTRLPYQQLQDCAQTHVHQVGDGIQPSHPLLSPSPLVFNLSQHQSLFQRVSSLHQVAKGLEFSISPSNECLGLISFRIDWFDFLAVQGTLKSLLQHLNSKSSILWCSAFFIVQLSHPYMTTRKIIALIRWSFVGKVMALLFFFKF